MTAKAPRTCLVVTALVLSALTSVACTPARPVERHGGVLTIAMPAGVDWVDPHRAAVATPLLQALYETLVVRDADFAVRPGLAHTWTVSPDRTEIAFQLRAGIAFHDGTKLDAQAVAVSFERVTSGNVEEFPVAKLLGPLREVRADGLTLTLAYDRPYPPAWTALADARLGIVSPTSIAALDAIAGVRDPAAQPPMPAGTGPYQLSAIGADVIELKPNASYAWPPAGVENQGSPYPDALRFALFSVQHSTELVAASDLLWWPSTEVLPGELDVATAGWRSQPFGGGTRVIYLALVTSIEPLDEPDVRQAIAWLTDRHTVPRHLGHPLLLVDWPFVTTLVPNPPLAAPPDDPRAAALGLLAGAGWQPDERGLLTRDDLPLTLRVATLDDDPAFLSLAGELVEAWQGAGIDARLVPARRFVQPGRVVSAPSIWLLRYDWHDPDVAYYLFHSSQIGLANRSGLADERLDGLLEQGRLEMDPELRHAAYREVADIVLRERAIIPLAQAGGELRVSARVAGWAPGAPGVVLPHDLYLRGAPGR